MSNFSHQEFTDWDWAGIQTWVADSSNNVASVVQIVPDMNTGILHLYYLST